MARSLRNIFQFLHGSLLFAQCPLKSIFLCIGDLIIYITRFWGFIYYIIVRIFITKLWGYIYYKIVRIYILHNCKDMYYKIVRIYILPDCEEIYITNNVGWKPSTKPFSQIRCIFWNNADGIGTIISECFAKISLKVGYSIALIVQGVP